MLISSSSLLIYCSPVGLYSWPSVCVILPLNPCTQMLPMWNILTSLKACDNVKWKWHATLLKGNVKVVAAGSPCTVSIWDIKGTVLYVDMYCIHSGADPYTCNHTSTQWNSPTAFTHPCNQSLLLLLPQIKKIYIYINYKQSIVTFVDQSGFSSLQ